MKKALFLLFFAMLIAIPASCSDKGSPDASTGPETSAEAAVATTAAVSVSTLPPENVGEFPVGVSGLCDENLVEFAKACITDRIAALYASGYTARIDFAEITDIGFIGSYDGILDFPVELFRVAFRLTTSDSTAPIPDGFAIENGRITEKYRGGEPLMALTSAGGIPVLLGCTDTDTLDKAGGGEAYLKDWLMPGRRDFVYLIFDKSNGMKTTLSTGDGAYRSEITVTDRWYAERFNAVMDAYSWEKYQGSPDIDSLKRTSDLVLTVSSSDGRQSLTLFSGSDFVLCASNANTRWYEVKAVDGGTLFHAIRTEFDCMEEKDALDKIKVYSYGSDFQKIAESFAKEYLKNLTALSPGSTYRITDCKMTYCAVFLTDDADKTKFAFSLAFVIKPVDFENTFWWAGNTVTGDFLKNSGFTAIPENELKNWLYLSREIRLDYNAAGGFWHCTDCGTGGITLT